MPIYCHDGLGITYNTRKRLHGVSANPEVGRDFAKGDQLGSSRRRMITVLPSATAQPKGKEQVVIFDARLML